MALLNHRHIYALRRLCTSKNLTILVVIIILTGALLSWSSRAEAKLARQFQPSITQQEKSQFMEALKLLTEALESAGIRYFMFGGTLIGSWRHHDMIPWDDDIDLMVNVSDRETVGKLNFTRHTMNTMDSFRYRFMCNNGTPAKGEPQSKWPFIDLVFYEDNGTHIHNIWKPKSNIHVYSNSDILPLSRRPFGSLSLYASRKPLVIIGNAAEVCMTRDASHRDVVALKTIYTVKCNLLHNIYPFVVRSPNNDTEELYLGEKLLHSVRISASG